MKRTFYILTAVVALLVLGSWMKSKDLSAESVYPGGAEAVDSYMNIGAQYPAEEKKAGKEGFVLVRFEVSDKGKAQHPVVTSMMRDSSAGFNAEARRLIAEMGSWEPAKDRKGKPTSSWHRTYVRFSLPDSLITLPVYTGDSLGEEMPRYPGGEAAFQYYLQQMIQYPRMEKEMGKDGTVYIYFEVSKSGGIGNVKCQKGIPGAPGLGKEAIRVISIMPRWEPGRIAGRPVKVGMSIPVKFTLQ